MSSATTINNCESGDCVQQPSTSTNPSRSRRTTARRVVEDDLTPAERAISDTPLLRGTYDVPLPRSTQPIRRHRGTRKRSLGTSSARVDEDAGTSSNTAYGAGSSDADTSPTRSRRTTRRRFIEDDLTPAEIAISDAPLLRDLGKHPSVYARAGRGPRTQNLNFRGAWRNAVELYRKANYQYKKLFDNAGFGDFLKIEPLELPQGYLIALMERWFAETNTLHLPCCEIGPTPVDWTMITGLRFKGQCIRLRPEYTEEKALELLGNPDGAITESKIRLSKIRPEVEEVMADPPTDEAKKIMFRRLFLYVVGSCFFGNNRSVIHYELVQFLENVDEVGRYNWGAITYAAFLAGMRRKVTGETGSFTAFWQFLLFWAFEYLNISRPEHTEEDIFPRAMRWNYPRNLGSTDISELTATRCQLDYVDDESQVNWQPYMASEDYSSDAMDPTITLAKNRVQFMSFETWEYYLGERCRRQLGLPCVVPHPPPVKMHGKSEDFLEDQIGVGISAESFVNEGEEYAFWFANNSIGKIVDVTQVIGGPHIGRKVIGHWVAKHRPGMILIPQSEVKEITEARDAARAKCTKLREELSRVRRDSDS